MLQSALDRRAFLTSGLASGLCILGGFDAYGAAPDKGDEMIRLRFLSGAPVPLWLEVSTIPGAFGTDVELAEERIPEAEQEAFERWGYCDIPQTRLMISAAGHMEVGESLIRYPGAVASVCRAQVAAKHPYTGRVWRIVFVESPGTWMWTNDGRDLLLYAKVAEPEYRIVNSRLAERVLYPAT